MLVRYWGSEDWSNEARLSELRDQNESYIISGLLNALGKEAVRLSTVEIETVNRCNNDCSFCPVNRNFDVRELCYMEESLFKKIIDDLAGMEYDGIISLFSNNEPLIDRRIFDFLSYARSKLPKAKHALFTNGLLLDSEKYEKLTESLDYLTIDNYNDEILLNDQIKELCSMDFDIKNNCKVRVEVRKKSQVLLNRGALAPNKKNSYTFISPCILPFIQMVIRPDGKVSRCCQDAYGNITLGDLNTQTVKEVWEGDSFQKLREELTNERKNIRYCSSCDLLGLINYYPPEWNFIYYEQVIDLIKRRKGEGKKIVLYNLEDAEVWVNVLKAKNIVFDYLSFGKDAEAFISEEFFLVMDKYDGELLEDLDTRGRRALQDFIIFSRQNLDYRMDEKKRMSDDIDRMLKASAEQRLVLVGAGETARLLVEGYHIKPRLITDNAKCGGVFQGTVVKSVEELAACGNNQIVLIAAADYIQIVRQLNNMGISSRNILLGIYMV